ncbi:hypothetical protein C460_04515 [Haloferax sp. ATCC BAA-646]|nr:hypothetical protein C460_04515 [Haloferax sp. ATCC BAA-646]ELZ64358.1 hypothetical protein C459_07505 [Haloferax sp. ATCC BAA-645]
MAEQHRRERGEAEPRDGPVDRVRGRRSESADEAGAPTLRKRSLDAQDADWTDRRGYRDAENESADEDSDCGG